MIETVGLKSVFRCPQSLCPGATAPRLLVDDVALSVLSVTCFRGAPACVRAGGEAWCPGGAQVAPPLHPPSPADPQPPPHPAVPAEAVQKGDQAALQASGGPAGGHLPLRPRVHGEDAHRCVRAGWVAWATFPRGSSSSARWGQAPRSQRAPRSRARPGAVTLRSA